MGHGRILSSRFFYTLQRCAQGYYIDTDGTLANSATISPTAQPTTWALPAVNATLHSTVNNTLFDPEHCVYNEGEETALCSPRITWRRMLLNRWAAGRPASAIPPGAAACSPLRCSATRPTRSPTACLPARLPACSHGPESIKFRTLLVVDEATNGSSTIPFSKYNENGWVLGLETAFLKRSRTQAAGVHQFLLGLLNVPAARSSPSCFAPAAGTR
jgi:hypothetical protein